MDLGELYAGPWSDFVGNRDRWAAAAKAAGDPVGSRAIKALKKPTRGAWLVNLLVRHEAARLTELFELGESLARAHRDADPEELRRLSGLRGAVVNSLSGRASALGAERGYAAPDAVRQEVAETIQAAMADPDLADRVLEGALTATVRAAGFGPVDLFAPAAGLAEVIQLRPTTRSAQSAEPAAEPPVEPAVPPGPDPAEIRRLNRELGRAEARWEESRDRVERIQELAAAAAAELAQHDIELAEVRALVTELRAALEAAQGQEEALLAHGAGLAADAERLSAAAERATEEAGDFSALVDRLSAELAALDPES
ncbi:MAG: hypothetical protein Q4G46_04170 [Propionibacteriaceae bacterium]|nr:hypothetical protein [Propionibacteriaceae bacterium]